MKIVVLYFDSNIGGAQKAIDLQSNELEFAGHDIHRLSIHPIHDSRILWLGGNSIRGSIIGIIKEYYSFEADILMTTLYGPGKSALLSKVISLGHVKYIYREATNISKARSLIGKVWTYFIIKFSRASIFNSIEQAANLSKVHNNIHYVPNLYESTGVTRVLNKTIIMVGRCNRVKRFEMGIKRIASIQDYKLVIYTTSGNSYYLEELNILMKKLGVSNRVDIRIDITDKRLIYSNEILYLASEYEGSPNVFIEALSRGVPCISEDFTFGVRELLDSNTGSILRLNDQNDYFLREVVRLRKVSSHVIKEVFESRKLNNTAKTNLLNIINRSREDE